ncbi:aspartate--tRNA(Asn) ligase [Lachnospiraceae bacterium MD329]|nr:aspartate--tRNA(Asn) ligase [Lachnospiraceae bacterium MD329]
MQRIDGQQLIGEITLEDLERSLDSSVTFSACVHKLRKMSGFTFVILRTGKYILQSVYTPKQCTDSISELCEGAYITVTGIVKKEVRANYGYEITLTSFELLSKPAEEYPLHVSSKKLGCSIETSMAHRSVALRHPQERAVFKISEGVVSGFREFMLSQGFTEIHTPKIVAAGAEGGANIFKLKYFDKDAYLAQSPQFYKQTCVAFFDRVFEIAPVYRAEKHNSTRHLNEYIGLDFEMAFINDMHDVMAMETAMLKYVIEYLSKNYSHELEMLNAELPVIDEIPCVTFFEALDILGKSHNQFDLDPTDEVKLCDYAKEQFNSEFIFVEKFPGLKRPFYAMDSKDDPKLAESFDLLFRGLEITTGGQRIHDYNEQVEKLRRYHIEPEELGSYIDIHRYGMPPHGGLGIGLERVVMKLLGLSNIREASLFPRDIHHLDP